MKTHRFLAVGCVLALMATSAVAASGITTRMLEAQYMDISLVVDGTNVTPKDVNGNVVEPFMVDGTVYLPVRALGSALGKDVSWDAESKTVHMGVKPAGTVGFTITSSGTVISTSSFFQAAEGQTLHLDVTTDITGGSVDFILFDPSGREQRITIGGADMTKEIALTEGTWAYTCVGKFTSGSFQVVGTVQ